MIAIMPTLRDFLEKINIRAHISYEEPMARHTTFRIGGPAEALVAPANREDFVRLVESARSEGIPTFILGGGANLLVGDGGMRGLVLDTSALAALEEGAAKSEGILAAEAGLSVDRLCEAARDRGLEGLETFYGMPGSLGGAAFMNARCYDVEMADRIAWVEVLRPGAKEPERLPFAAEAWAYKKSPFQPGGEAEGSVILAVAYRLREGEREAIEKVMRDKKADREAKGHYRLPSAGSVFKNNRDFGRPSGKILDELGLRGKRIGGALVSEWHANIFVNAGGATAADMRSLIELAQSEARLRLGLELEPEVLMVGDFCSPK
jgi:UDP-N-acetylmuramate dehydrogenase